MIENMNELDSWLMENEKPCPFFECGSQTWFFCGVENLKITVELEAELGTMKCCSLKGNEFLTCPAYLKALAEYRRNPVEFQNYLTAINGKLLHMETRPDSARVK